MNGRVSQCSICGIYGRPNFAAPCDHGGGSFMRDGLDFEAELLNLLRQILERE